jgi:hypothetical protein
MAKWAEEEYKMYQLKGEPINKIVVATKKPVTIFAIEYDGDNVYDVIDFCGKMIVGNERKNVAFVNGADDLIINTLEGYHIASIGDYIIEGVEKEYYPCKPAIFHKTYNIEA